MKRKGRRFVLSTGIVAVAFLALATYLAWPHLLFWYRFAPLGLNAEGYPEYRHRQTGIVFVRLPGGKFWMGAQSTDPQGRNYDRHAEADEGPVHEVTLSPYLIGKFQVTEGQFKGAVGTFPTHLTLNGVDRPLERVWYEDFQAFKAKTGLLLPTEAQWEFASTIPTGKRPPNKFGILDLQKKVFELCEDKYDKLFYGSSDACGPDPLLKAGSAERVARGGLWRPNFGRLPAYNPLWIPPAGNQGVLGFRAAFYPLP